VTGDFVFRAATPPRRGAYDPEYDSAFTVTIGSDVSEWRLQLYHCDDDHALRMHSNNNSGSGDGSAASLPPEQNLIGYVSFTVEDLMEAQSERMHFPLRNDNGV
jgi:hypothetical protein